MMKGMLVSCLLLLQIFMFIWCSSSESTTLDDGDPHVKQLQSQEPLPGFNSKMETNQNKTEIRRENANEDEVMNLIGWVNKAKGGGGGSGGGGHGGGKGGGRNGGKGSPEIHHHAPPKKNSALNDSSLLFSIFINISVYLSLLLF
ncbi:hypothetical protein IHE45_16G059100 [Dioscorea alata]|uniref:Uncharacterized protein n=1 Tax=Dioscorea alata TaxID=55571 RepID=A0ACB7UHN0_DIOAL|nr:hypothetical protein IHE45_16G059100 [Dioscorea alata]